MMKRSSKYLALFMGLSLLVPLHASHGNSGIPVPAQKPLKPVQGTTISSSSVPLPGIKPASIQSNNKKLVSTPDGGVKMIHKDDRSPFERLFFNKQVDITRDIFQAQAKGDIAQADALMVQLKSDNLLGHILAERYLHPTAYDSSFDELKNWLGQYSDHPQAMKIYDLAKQKYPSQSASLPRPEKQKQIAGNVASKSQSALNYKTTKRRNADQQNRVEKLTQEIRSKTKKGQASLALNILNNDYGTQFMDDVEYDEMRALIASSYFYALKFDSAYRQASLAYNRSGDAVPLAGWIKGLVEWKQGRYANAALSFESAASSRYASGWLSSAAAYWAARAYQQSADQSKMNANLSLAAAHPRTFYGLIAARALGRDNHFNWKIPSMSRDDARRIEATNKGKRASLLIQAGQISLAEAELKTLPINGNNELKKSLLAYANHHKLPSVLMMMGNALSTDRGNYYDAALYPQAEWISSIDFEVDEALMNAFVRQESRFNQLAANPSGATGLMQLMPSTANHVVGKEVYNSRAGRYDLRQPDKNLDIGQRYIQELLSHPAVKNDVINLAVAYNAGPGNLSKWKRERNHITDPLLFIETIPFHETRAFVERIMANYWVYRMREGKSTPTLDALAAGKGAKIASR